MKVFLINLDKDTARMAAANAQLSKFNVLYERISAIYGKNLSLEERNTSVNKFRWWCAVGRPIALGEIGCALSHYQIYQRMIEENISSACILEDDVILEKDFKRQLKMVEQWLEVSKPQVVLLSNHTHEVCHDWKILPAQSDMYTEGYVITQMAAKALLKVNLPMEVPCDHWGRWVQLKVIKLYHAFPSVCSQDQSQYPSGTVDASRFNVVNLSPFRWILHKFKRVVGKPLDKLFMMIKW